MCGRMTMRTDVSDVALIFDAEVRDPEAFADLGPRYNVAPTQPIEVVVQREDGRVVELHRWGLVPSFAKSLSVGSRHINARAETIATTPAFRTSFAKRRCIIPADGFYEWRREAGSKRKQPFLIHAADDRPLAFAGVWAPWKDPATGAWVLTAAVVTTQANGVVGQLHNRMPVILEPSEWPIWADSEIRDPGLLNDLLRPAPDGLLTLTAVSTAVNNANNEGPELLLPPDVIGSDALTLFG
ncbi:MAG TPA: SOS response-associated peptidase [Candidatus Limnocylindria bacterium]|nr:SOS response-associated peptidase [Candidatus Limnocylindria bacterium]